MAPQPPSDGPPQTASSYPQVAVEEVLDVLHEVGLHWVTAEDINKVTQQSAYRILAHFLELLSGINQEWLEKRRQEALVNVDHRELYEESLTWILFYREIAVLMQASQVRDFTSHDVLRPQPKRFRRHLSALVNFYRFRQERLEEFEQFSLEMDELIERKEELLAWKDTARDKIASIHSQRERDAPRAAELAQENEEVSNRLYELKKEQSRLLHEVDQLKAKKAQLVASQTDLTVQVHSANEQVRKLQSRIVTSPKELRAALGTLSRELKERKAHLVETERKAKDFDARIALMKGIEDDLVACQNLLVSLSTDQGRLENIQKELRGLESDYETASSTYSQVSQTLSADSKQLVNAQNRWERMRKTLDGKRAQWKKREEDWTKLWDETEGEKRKRNEEANRKQREGRDIEREIEAELRAYDAEVASMIKQRNDLVKLAESYMEAMTVELDLDGQGLIVEEDDEGLSRTHAYVQPNGIAA